MTTTSSFTIIPSHYNATPYELVKLANQLAMSPEIIQSPFRRSKWFPPLQAKRSNLPETRVKITPHGHTPEQRLHSLMFFFHCLGQSKCSLSDDLTA